MKKIILPQFAWFGDKEVEISFPEDWDIHLKVMKGEGKLPITREKIISSLREPIGTKPLNKLAENKKDRS